MPTQITDIHTIYKRPGHKQEKERTSELYAKSKSQLFFQFSPPALPPSLVPLYGSHLSCSQPEERGVRFIRPTCVCRVQTTLCAEIICVCVRLYISVYTNFIYVRLYSISVYRFYIRVCCFGNAVYGDWSLLAKFLRPLKQPTSTVSRFQFCDPLKKDNTPLIVILGIRRTLGQNSLDTGTVEG